MKKRDQGVEVEKVKQREREGASNLTQWKTEFRWKGKRVMERQTVAIHQNLKRRQLDEWQWGWGKMRGWQGVYNSEWQTERETEERVRARESGWRNKGVTEWRIEWVRGHEGEKLKSGDTQLEVICQIGKEKKWEYNLIRFSKAIRSTLYHSSALEVCTSSLSILTEGLEIF